jgi:tRNA pseudouridine55 synthase
MKGRVLNLYKRLGETPLECLTRLRREHSEFAEEVLSYAGRLDPMAEGVLLALVGSANNRREKYLDLSKVYRIDVLFGFATDTYDVLGKVVAMGDPSLVGRAAVAQAQNEFRGEVDQEYPPFSSKVVEGKSLFAWAKDNALGALTMPRKTVTVYDIALEAAYKVGESALLTYIEESVGKVRGNFRQEEIMRLWNRHLALSGERTFPAATIAIECSSGTYVRSIAHGLGHFMGVPSLALRILRTKVGEYSIEKSLH